MKLNTSLPPPQKSKRCKTTDGLVIGGSDKKTLSVTFSKATKAKDSSADLKTSVKVIKGADTEVATKSVTVSPTDATKLVIVLADSVRVANGETYKVTVANNAFTDLSGVPFAKAETESETIDLDAPGQGARGGKHPKNNAGRRI